MSGPANLPRRRRAGVSTLVGLIVLAVCVLAAYAAVQIAMGNDQTVLGNVNSVAGWGRKHDWTQIGVLIAGIVAAALGLLLLVGGLLPARRALLPLAPAEDGIVAGIARPGLARDLAVAVARVDGVDKCKVRVRRSRVRVKVRSALRDNEGLRDSARAAVDARLAELRPARPVRVRVRVKKAHGS